MILPAHNDHPSPRITLNGVLNQTEARLNDHLHIYSTKASLHSIDKAIPSHLHRSIGIHTDRLHQHSITNLGYQILSGNAH